MFDVKPGPFDSECSMFVYLGPIEGSECLMLSFTLSQHALRPVPDYRFIFSLLTSLYFGRRQHSRIVSLRFRLNYTCGVLRSFNFSPFFIFNQVEVCCAGMHTVLIAHVGPFKPPSKRKSRCKQHCAHSMSELCFTLSCLQELQAAPCCLTCEIPKAVCP